MIALDKFPRMVGRQFTTFIPQLHKLSQGINKRSYHRLYYALSSVLLWWAHIDGHEYGRGQYDSLSFVPGEARGDEGVRPQMAQAADLPMIHRPIWSN